MTDCSLISYCLPLGSSLIQFTFRRLWLVWEKILNQDNESFIEYYLVLYSTKYIILCMKMNHWEEIGLIKLTRKTTTPNVLSGAWRLGTIWICSEMNQYNTIQLYCLCVEKFAYWLDIYIKRSIHLTIKINN